MLRLRGGGKKRKKKTYTKPKKVKHVHKAVKLAVLKFYRVDDNGKVQRLRKSCPNEECGVGVRMAVHKDRFYCGKCSLTVSRICLHWVGWLCVLVFGCFSSFSWPIRLVCFLLGILVVVFSIRACLHAALCLFAAGACVRIAYDVSVCVCLCFKDRCDA